MAGLYVRVAGTYQKVTGSGLWVRVAGTWNMVKSGWVRVSGVWQQFHFSTTTLTLAATGTRFDGIDSWNGVDGVGVSGGTFGTGGSYTDGGGNSRTVTTLVERAAGTDVYLEMSVASIPNTDTTFRTMFGLLRSSATYTANVGGRTRWTWSTGGPVGLATSGSQNVTVGF